MEHIPQLAELLKPEIGDAKITSCTTKSLIAAGENYGSIMLAIDLELNGKEELHLVGKMCPTSDFIKQLFNVGVTFKKEVAFYKTIVPTLKHFQTRNNCTTFTCFAKCYGTRYSLDPNITEVDEGCCLILENLKMKGYGNEDRMVGFNLDCARFLVQDLATFHSVPVALKLREPDTFKRLIYDNICAPNYTKLSLPVEEAEKIAIEVIERTKLLKKYEPHILAIEKMCKSSVLNLYEPQNDVVEPYATIVHADYWTNNTMIKKDEEGRCVSNCIVDYQLLTYGSPFTDLMFFLYTSVQIPVLKEHYDELIDLYYKTFIENLKALKVEDLEPFSKDRFLAGISESMKRLQMYHCLFMLTPIYAKKEKATELAELDMSSINDRSKMDTEKYFERLEFLLDEFVKRGWLTLN